jgi:hypothetical protein
VGISAVVFDEQAAPIDGNLSAWFKAERAAAPKGAWQRPKTSSNVLNSWFSEMRETFPSLYNSDPEDLHGTDYSFYKHFVRIDFAGPVGEEGVVRAWKLASKHGLRILAGDELLPRSAPEGERRIHITVLDGGKARAQSTGPPNICIAVLDPEFAPASGAKQWIIDQLDVEEGSDNPIMESGRLKQWNDEFTVSDSSCVHSKFYHKFILLRFRPNDLDRIAAAAIELAKRFHLGLLFFENL